MLSRLLPILALAAYVTVLGCVFTKSATHNEDGPLADLTPTFSSLTPAEAAASRHADPKSILPMRGAGMQIQRVDWIDKYKQSVDEIADLGADTVMFEVDARMENGTSNRIYLDMRMTPTPDQLGDLIDHAKRRNLKVVLMPIVLLDDPRGNEWRGTIKPESWDQWFASYRDVLTHFAWIAELHHADVFVLGSELVSTENKLEEWDTTIRQVRQTFHGLITYSSNWDHYTTVPFWKKLDLVGMNSYWDMSMNNGHRLDRKDVTVDTISKRWAEIQKDVLGFTKKVNKPLLLVEVGWCSQANAAETPWDYTVESEPIDNELQKKLYQAFFKSWYGNPNLGGFMVWEWTAGDGGDGSLEDRRGYTPENKPAQDVIREYFKKGPWKVN